MQASHIWQRSPWKPNLQEHLTLLPLARQVPPLAQGFGAHKSPKIILGIELEQKIEEFEKILSIKGVDFYRFIGDEKSKYLDFHKLSIKLLKNFKKLN